MRRCFIFTFSCTGVSPYVAFLNPVRSVTVYVCIVILLQMFCLTGCISRRSLMSPNRQNFLFLSLQGI